MGGVSSSENDSEFESVMKSLQKSDPMLNANECEFGDPKVSYNFTFSDQKVYIIDDDLLAEKALQALQACHVLYVDCIGENFGSPNVKLGLVQIATSSQRCFIFTCKCKTEFEVLKVVLEDEKIRKVFHDCTHDIAALALATIGGQQGITVRNFEDIQIAQLFVRKSRKLELVIDQLPKLSLSELYTYCFGGDFPEVNTGPEGNSSKWISGFLDERMIQHAALQVLLLESMYEHLMRNIRPMRNMNGYRNMVAEVSRR